MDYHCKICKKEETCKKNKNSNNTNCRLFVPSSEKEMKLLKERAEAKERLEKFNKEMYAAYGKQFEPFMPR